MSAEQTLTRDDRAAKVLLAARDRELRSYLAQVPDAREYAYRMPAWMAEDLMTAQRRQCSLFLDLRVAKRLRPFGLVDYVSTNLTAFGYAVWKALHEGDA